MREALTREEWSRRAHAHAERVTPHTRPFLDRRSRGEKHPVEDFLFTYYSQSAGSLQRWHPGLGMVLADDAEGSAAAAEAEEFGK